MSHTISSLHECRNSFNFQIIHIYDHHKLRGHRWSSIHILLSDPAIENTNLDKHNSVVKQADGEWIQIKHIVIKYLH